MKKGQASLEYLIITMVALALITFSVFALFSVKNAADNSTNSVKFRASSGALFDSVKEVCILGSGNSQKIVLETTLNASVDSNGALVLSSGYGNFTRGEKTKCEVNTPTTLSGQVLIENSDGKITLSD